MKAVFTVALVALALCACGPHYAKGVVPPPSPSPGLGFDLAVSEKSTTATMKVGQKLEVILHAKQGMTPWNGVRSSDQSVLAPIVNPAATAARGITLAAFQALSPGEAQITATAGADCSPGQACPMYAMLLRIDVTVVAA
jgi:hypothetical protein